jgi:fatty acid-binding protein DegV
MGSVQVFTDSLSDLPQVWIRQYNIGIVTVYLVFSNKEFYKDQIEITIDQIY